MFRLLGLFLGACALVSCTTPLRRQSEPPSQKEGFVRTELDNGLKVVLLEDH